MQIIWKCLIVSSLLLIPPPGAIDRANVIGNGILVRRRRHVVELASKAIVRLTLDWRVVVGMRPARQRRRRGGRDWGSGCGEGALPGWRAEGGHCHAAGCVTRGQKRWWTDGRVDQLLWWSDTRVNFQGQFKRDNLLSLSAGYRGEERVIGHRSVRCWRG